MENLEPIEFDKWKELKSEVAHFLRDKFRFVLISEKLEQPIAGDTKQEAIIQKFSIPNGKTMPVYRKLNGPGELKVLFKELGDDVEELKDSFASIIEQYESQVDENFQETLHMLYRLTERLIRTVQSRTKSFKFEDAIDVQEMREQLYLFLKKLISEKFIEVLIPPIYEGMKHGGPHVVAIYELLLEPIRVFLQKQGIYTYEIQEEQKMDYDLCTTVDSDSNETSEYRLKEAIKEVKQYPYVFDETHLVSEGKAIVWRFMG